MKLNTLYIINTIAGVLFGLAWLLIPQTIGGLYGDAVIPPESIVLARLLGAAYIGYAVLTWFARAVVDPNGRRAILSSLTVSYAVGLIVILLAQFSGLFNALNWMNVVIFLLFTLAFGYFLIKGSNNG